MKTSTTKIKVNQEVLNFLRETCGVVETDREYFYIPFWFSKTDNEDVLEIFFPEDFPKNLPKDLKLAILKKREL